MFAPSYGMTGLRLPGMLPCIRPSESEAAIDGKVLTQ